MALRSQKEWPQDPNAYMIDYFGNERSPLWEEMDEMNEENTLLADEFPAMQEELLSLQAQLE